MRLLVEPWRLLDDPALRDKHANRKCGGRDVCPACQLLQALYASKDECARAANVALRARWRADAETLDAFMAEHGRPPKKGAEWPTVKFNTYQQVRRVAPGLSTSTASSLARAVDQKWAEKRWISLIFTKERPPHWQSKLPVPLRAAELKLRALGGDRYGLSAAIRSGDDGRFTLPITVKDRAQNRVLHALTQGHWKIGAAQLEQDRLRPSTWYLRLSYKREVDVVAGPEVTAGINRGIRCFLAAITSTGEQCIYGGTDIVAFLKQMQRRRREYQRQLMFSNRRSHGRKRALKPIEKLEGTAERWRQTRCQTIARSFVRWLVQQKVTKLYVEDFTGIRDFAVEDLGEHVGQLVQEWPYYQLQTRLVSCAEEAGLTVEQVPAEHISQTCPSCGHVDPENVDLKSWLMKCVECGHKRHLDVAAAWNVRVRGATSGGKVLIGDGAQKKKSKKKR